MLQYTLIRSRRKTVAIHITKTAEVEVRAPLKINKAYIDEFVASKEGWIQRHLARRELLNNEKFAFTLDYGDTVTLCGKTYLIRAKDGKCACFDNECFFIPPCLAPEGVKRSVVHIYKTAAAHIIRNKTDEYSKRITLSRLPLKLPEPKRAGDHVPAKTA